MTDTQREAFDAWYVDNCPDIITEPIGCRTFTLQFGAWQAAITQAQAQQATQEQSVWCEYVAGIIDHWVRTDEYASIRQDRDRCTKAIAGIIERRVWALKHEVTQPQAQQAAAVPADVAPECFGIFDSQGIYSFEATEQRAKDWCDKYNARETDPLKPYSYRPLFSSPQFLADQEADAYLVEWEGDGKTWAVAHTSYVVAADEASRTGGKLIELFRCALTSAPAAPQALSDEQCDAAINRAALNYIADADSTNRDMLRKLCREAVGTTGGEEPTP